MTITDASLTATDHGDDGDDGLCSVRWCDETQDHPGAHRGYLGDLLAVRPGSSRTTLAQVILQGASSRVKTIVMVVNGDELALTWSQVRSLATLLDAAAIKHGERG